MERIRRLRQMVLRIRKNDRLKFTKHQPSLWDQLWVRLVILALLTTTLVLLLPSQRAMQYADFKEGSISPRRIIAPFSFEILKTQDEYQLDREDTRKRVQPIFNRDQELAESQIHLLQQFFNKISLIRGVLEKNSRLQKSLQDSLRKEFNLSGIEVQTWELLLDPSKRIGHDELSMLEAQVKRTVRDLLAIGILNQEKAQMSVPDQHLIINEKREEVIYPFDNFLDLPEARTRVMQRMDRSFPQKNVLAQLGYNIISFFLRPNLILDETIYQARIEEAVSRVPRSRGFVIEQEKIVDKNERITPEIRKKLYSLSMKMAEMGIQQGGIKVVLPYLGKVCFVLAFLFLLAVYVHLKSPLILERSKPVFLLSLIIILVSVSTYFISKISQQEDISDPAITTAIGAMLLAMIFDEKIGYVGAAILSVFVGSILGNDFNIMAVSFFTGVIGIIVIKRLQNRSQLLQAILYIIAANIFILSAMGFMRYAPGGALKHQIEIAVMIGTATPILTYLLLAIFEKMFDITTDFRLLELSNLNHELMKQLSVEATGTYHHSIQVGNLAEAAARAVGANSLLARVGSYYHDVGKLEKSEYFIENLLANENPHQKLTPRMSALILSNHVKRGLELADKYGLPSSIKDIMVQHHGTTLMSFFYQKALAKKGSDEVNENDYKYTGPKPQSKEAAIVMLADSIEAAARALKDPTHSRLKGVVEDLVDERFKEGELDESPLTLRDLERIKEAFLKILAGIFHTRIEYPDREEKSNNQKNS
ncbi:HDIG domain-containing protein [bacterium]|nr:HDIG domain-containing protein [bacterium]